MYSFAQFIWKKIFLFSPDSAKKSNFFNDSISSKARLSIDDAKQKSGCKIDYKILPPKKLHSFFTARNFSALFKNKIAARRVFLRQGDNLVYNQFLLPQKFNFLRKYLMDWMDTWIIAKQDCVCKICLQKLRNLKKIFRCKNSWHKTFLIDVNIKLGKNHVKVRRCEKIKKYELPSLKHRSII